MHLKPINNVVYMKKERSFHLTVYCALKWNDFSLQIGYLKHLSRPTFDESASEVERWDKISRQAGIGPSHLSCCRSHQVRRFFVANALSKVLNPSHFGQKVQRK